MDTCPSTFALDDREIHGAPPDDAVGRHVAACRRCAMRATTRAALDERFRSRFRDPLWRRVQAAPARRSWWRTGILAPALAAVAAVVLLRTGVRWDSPPAPATYRAPKGASGISVHIDARRGGRVFRFDDSTPALPGDEIQLTIAATAADQRYVLVGSVDGTGTFSPFYPATLDGHSVALPPPGQPLTPSIVLDAAPGPERIVVVRSARPLAVSAVAALARAAAPRQERFAVSGGTGDADIHADVQWVTLQKTVPTGKAPEAP